MLNGVSLRFMFREQKFDLDFILFFLSKLVVVALSSTAENK